VTTSVILNGRFHFRLGNQLDRLLINFLNFVAVERLLSSMIDVDEPAAATGTLEDASNSSLAQAPYWTTAWRVGLAATLAVIMAAAVVGNSLVVVVVLRNRGMRTRTNLFLCNLAVADLLCAAVDMPFSLITVASGRWIFNDVVCKVRCRSQPSQIRYRLLHGA